MRLHPTTLILFLFCLLPLAGFAQEDLKNHPPITNEWLVIPGQQVGAIQSNTTRTTLTHHFNRRVIRDYTKATSNGIQHISTVNERTINSLTVFWKDENRTSVDRVEINGWIGSNWYLESGLRVGLTVYDQLLEINQQPVLFKGFYNEKNGGTITNWNGGRLSNNQQLTVQLWYSGSCELTELNSYDFLGNKEHSTSEELAQFLELRVYKITVQL